MLITNIQEYFKVIPNLIPENTRVLDEGSAKHIAYAPFRKSSLAVITAGEPWYKDGKTNMMPEMPSSKRNTKNYFLVDALYWADNGTELGEMYEAMKAGLKN